MTRPFSIKWKKEWTGIIALVLFLRVLYAALGVMAVAGGEPEVLSKNIIYERAAPFLHDDTLARLYLNPWFRWDTVWYVKIAALGFDGADGTTVYPPLLPLLMRGLAWIVGDYLLAGLILGTLSAATALILLYEVARIEGFGVNVALQSVLSLVLFPTAFFLLAAYTDALFLALALGAWCAARRRQFIFAGALASFAALTRLQGALLAPILFVVWLADELARAQQTWSLRSVIAIIKQISWRAWLGAALPALTFSAYNLWLHLSGFPPSTQLLENLWGISTVDPFTGIMLFIQRLLFTKRVFIDYIDLALFIFILVIAFISLRRLKPELSFYTFMMLGFFFTRGTPPHLLDSFSRYFLALFPLFIAIGSSPRRGLRAVYWALGFSANIILAWVFLSWMWVA